MARWMALAAAGVLVAGGAACASGAASEVEMCRRNGAATVCLRSQDGGPFSVSGQGFAPRSQLGLDIATGAGTMVEVDGEGRIRPAAGAPGFLPGLAAEEHVLEGTDGDGRAVSFLVRCWVDGAKRPICEV